MLAAIRAILTAAALIALIAWVADQTLRDLWALSRTWRQRSG